MRAKKFLISLFLIHNFVFLTSCNFDSGDTSERSDEVARTSQTILFGSPQHDEIVQVCNFLGNKRVNLVNKFHDVRMRYISYAKTCESGYVPNYEVDRVYNALNDVFQLYKCTNTKEINCDIFGNNCQLTLECKEFLPDYELSTAYHDQFRILEVYCDQARSDKDISSRQYLFGDRYQLEFDVNNDDFGLTIFKAKDSEDNSDLSAPFQIEQRAFLKFQREERRGNSQNQMGILKEITFEDECSGVDYTGRRLILK